MFNGLVKDSVALYAVTKLTRGSRKRGESLPLVNPFSGITKDWAMIKAQHEENQAKKEKVTQ